MSSSLLAALIQDSDLVGEVSGIFVHVQLNRLNCRAYIDLSDHSRPAPGVMHLPSGRLVHGRPCPQPSSATVGYRRKRPQPRKTLESALQAFAASVRVSG